MLDIALVQARRPQPDSGVEDLAGRSIASEPRQQTVSVVDIAERQGISASYLEQIFSKLKRAELIASVRGPGGGYRLTRPLSGISVSQIIAAVGDGVDATRCHGAADCADGAKCLTHDLWAELSSEIDEFMSNITLATLVQRTDSHTNPAAAHGGDGTGKLAAKGAANEALDLIAARHL